MVADNIRPASHHYKKAGQICPAFLLILFDKPYGLMKLLAACFLFVLTIWFTGCKQRQLAKASISRHNQNNFCD